MRAPETLTGTGCRSVHLGKTGGFDLERADLRADSRLDGRIDARIAERCEGNRDPAAIAQIIDSLLALLISGNRNELCRADDRFAGKAVGRERFGAIEGKLDLRAGLTDGNDTFGPDDGAASVLTNTRAGLSGECPNLGKFLSNLAFTVEALCAKFPLYKGM